MARSEEASLKLQKSRTKRPRTLDASGWVRCRLRARQAKGKARLNAYEELLNADTAQKIESVEIYIPPGPRLGDVVVEARGLRKAYGDRLLMDDLTFTLPRGGIVGVIGPNGAGKTTLFRMITGQEKADGGTLRVGETVQLGYVDQNATRSGRPDRLGGGNQRRSGRAHVGKRTVASRAYVSWVQLQGSRSAAQKSARCPAASGIACTWRSCCGGAQRLLLVSRPRTWTSTPCGRWRLRCCSLPVRGGDQPRPMFLDRIATHILAFEGEIKCSGSRGTIRTTKPIDAGAWARQPINRTGSSTAG